MTRGFKLDWNGDELVAAAERAEVAALNETVEATTAEAQRLAPEETGELKRKMAPIKARSGGDGASAGVRSDADHTFAVETGTYGAPGVHMLRRAADREFPQLNRRLGGEFRKRAPRR